MDRYTGTRCAYCKEYFKKDSDIVVCPDCGAPHHRSCYQQEGHCALQNKHGDGFAWHDSSRPAEDSSSAAAQRTCPFCGEDNPAAGIFCSSCGAPLTLTEQHEAPDGAETPPPFPFSRTIPPDETPGAAEGGPRFPGFDPYGGVAKDADIDGIPVTEMAAYVGQNSSYYLPRFKRMSDTGEKFSVNWSSLFIHFFHLFYRKMYGLAIVRLFLALITAIPDFIVMFETMRVSLLGDTASLFPTLPDYVEQFSSFSMIARVVVLCLSFVLAMLSNYLYKRKCVKNITRIKADNPDLAQPELLALLAKKGGVNRHLPFIVLISIFALSYLAVYYMLLFM